MIGPEPVEITVARMEAVLLRMEGKLFGNGQPGILAEHEEKIDDLQGSRDKVVGALTLVVFVLTLFGGVEVWRFIASPRAVAATPVLQAPQVQIPQLPPPSPH